MRTAVGVSSASALRHRRELFDRTIAAREPNVALALSVVACASSGTFVGAVDLFDGAILAGPRGAFAHARPRVVEAGAAAVLALAGAHFDDGTVVAKVVEIALARVVDALAGARAVVFALGQGQAAVVTSEANVA